MLKKIFSVILSALMIFVSTNFVVASTEAGGPKLVICDDDVKYEFDENTTNDTTIQNLIINYDESSETFILTTKKGKTVDIVTSNTPYPGFDEEEPIEEYWGIDRHPNYSIGTNANLLINGNGKLNITRVPNGGYDDNDYSSTAIY